MNVHDVQKVRSFEHPGAGRKRAKSTPKGRQIDPHGRGRDRASARRPAAAARSADRASAPDPGQLSPDLGGASRRACRRDEARLRRSVRDRDLLRAFRRGEGRRARHRAADHPRLRLPDLRHAGRGKTAAASCRTTAGPGIRVVRAPCVGLLRHARRWPKSAITSSMHATPAERARPRRERGETHAASARLCRLRRLCRRRRLRAARATCAPATSARKTS